ncbi:hypothetical protein [Phycicoccus sp. Root101]|uniref:hypothetical protein n=1 Tax=Phycicoccus sp. Root101 TaxID=1736421 RepID=UPI0007032602|nr:hypothetical protein [Phycicoccus sp. Root101]KQU64137.1 hypothetical protein ASC58_19695 [Phycicoccus sp. Root101]
MRTRTEAATLLAVGILLAGCGGAPDSGQATQSSSPPPSTTAPTSTAPATDKARIPDGTWTREVTKAEITRRGLQIPPEVITGNYLDDGSVRLVLKSQAARWSILVEDDAGAFEVGDQGGTSYDAEGRWVQASDSTGGSVLIDWKISGDTLTTSIPKSGPQLSDEERLFLEGPWHRQG